MTPSAGPGPGLGRIARVLTGIAACALVTMMLWTIADVGLRSTARIAIDGTVAAVETLLVLVAFFALADAIGRDELIRVDVFDTALGARRVRVLQALGEAATVVFLGLLVVTVLTPLMDAWQFGDVKPDLPVPIWTLLLAIKVALVAALFTAAARLLRTLATFLRSAPRPLNTPRPKTTLLATDKSGVTP